MITNTPPPPTHRLSIVCPRSRPRVVAHGRMCSSLGTVYMSVHVGTVYTRLQTVWSLPGHSPQANRGHSPRCHRRPNGPGRLADTVVQPTTQSAEGCTCRALGRPSSDRPARDPSFLPPAQYQCLRSSPRIGFKRRVVREPDLGTPKE